GAVFVGFGRVAAGGVEVDNAFHCEGLGLLQNVGVVAEGGPGGDEEVFGLSGAVGGGGALTEGLAQEALCPRAVPVVFLEDSLADVGSLFEQRDGFAGALLADEVPAVAGQGEGDVGVLVFVLGYLREDLARVAVVVLGFAQ